MTLLKKDMQLWCAGDFVLITTEKQWVCSVLSAGRKSHGKGLSPFQGKLNGR